MAITVNRTIVAGYLTRDPQVRFLANEKAVSNFSLAINNRYKAADGTPKEDTVFIDIEAWGRTAELVGQYLTKGRACLVEGRLRLDTWEKDGQKHSKLKVVADNVQFLDSNRQDHGASAPVAEERTPATEASAPKAPASGNATASLQDPGRHAAQRNPSGARRTQSATAQVGVVEDEPPF